MRIMVQLPFYIEEDSVFHIFFFFGGGAGPGTSLCKEMGQRSTLNRDQESNGAIRLPNLF